MFQWFTIPKNKKCRGVALVTHGLNLNPIRMKEIIDILNQRGIDALLLTFKGHESAMTDSDLSKSKAERMKSFKQVTYEIWRDEITEAYANVHSYAKRMQKPLYFVGYSLGGLMGCDLMASNSKVTFERMILFAPALKTHRVRVPFLKLFFKFPWVVIPSLSPTFYRANHGTPIAAYQSLLKAADNFKAKMNQSLNIPTLLFLDKNDELVSYKKMKRFIKSNNLTNWSLFKIKRKPEELKFPFHHIIIDSASTGSNGWLTIKQNMIEHLSKFVENKKPESYKIVKKGQSKVSKY